MWPWRRRTQRTVQRSTADAPAPAATAATDAGPSEPRRAGPPAWRGLPPIQRVTPEEPRLNLPEAFTGSLAAWRDPSYLAPLGHLVGGAEPAGVLHGAAIPVAEPPTPEPAGPQSPGDSVPLPLAAPPSAARRAAPSLQRQVLGVSAPGHQPAPDPPSAGQPPARSAAPEPMPLLVQPVPASRAVPA
ncbi:hypothetical protein ABZ671_13545, partial [Micromonospora sp. NPDC006766]